MTKLRDQIFACALWAGVFPAMAAATTPSLNEPGPADLIHRLVELDSRRHIKPDGLLRSSASEYSSERLIFRDTATGTEVWKMSHNPGFNRHGYSNIMTWNRDGTVMMTYSTRPPIYGAGRHHWLVAPDGSRWTPIRNDMVGDGWIYWNPLDPHRYYLSDSRTGEVYDVDYTTGDKRLLWRIPPAKGVIQKLFKPSADGKTFLFRESKVEVGNGITHSFAIVANADGTGGLQRIDLGREMGQIWLLNRSDRAFIADGVEFTDQSKDREWICEPEKNGAIRVFSRRLFNHAAISPGGKRAAYPAGSPDYGLRIIDDATGTERQCVTWGQRINRVGGGHFSWECDDRWIAGSAGNGIYEIWVDSGRTRPICVPNTQHGMRLEAEPESSPDGTKVAYNSTMMGDLDFYVAVQRQPDPPRNVRRQGRVLTWDPPDRCRELAGYCIYRGSELLNREPVLQCRYEVPEGEGSYTVVAVEHSGLQSACPDREPPPAPSGLAALARSPFAVELTWQRSPASDVSYYNVYCSTRRQPAAAQENRVASPNDPRLIDWGLQADTSYSYVLTAVDRAGNESRPSAPVAVRTPGIRRVFQAIALGKPLGGRPLAVALSVPRDDRYLLWIELKAEHAGPNQLLSLRLDGSGNVTMQPKWDYVCIGHADPASIPFFDLLKSNGSGDQGDPWFTLAAGSHRLDLMLPGGSAEIVSLILTNDAGFIPAGITRFRREHWE